MIPSYFTPSSGDGGVELSAMTETDLDALLQAVHAEREKRRSFQDVFQSAPELIEIYLHTLGRDSGAEYIAPKGAHEAYPLNWEVTYGGKLWQSTRNGANGVPGESPDWRQVPAEGEILPWVQPHAGQEYPPGATVTHLGRTWVNGLGDANGWEPGQAHSGWLAVDAPVEEPEEPEEPEVPEEPELPEDPEDPELPEEPEDPELPEEPEEPFHIEPWAQPMGGAEYPIGALVTHDGLVWRNTHDRNGWKPGTNGAQWENLGPIENYIPDETVE